MKLCVDCKHHRDFGTLGPEHVCLVEEIIDPVDGEPLGRPCRKAREINTGCGPEGKLFEAKE